MREIGHFVGGKQVKGTSGRQGDVFNPNTGEVQAKPTSLEIDLQASGNAELTSDALVKYRDALGRVKTAFDELKLPGLSFEQRALSIQNNGGATTMPGCVP